VPPVGIPAAPGVGDNPDSPAIPAPSPGTEGDNPNEGPALPRPNTPAPLPNEDGQLPSATATDEESGSARSETVPPVNLDSARINLPAVVEAYIARHSSKGVWTIKDKSGRVWHLKQPKTLADTTRNTGPGLYSAHVMLNTAKPPKHRLDLDFTVDFSGADWRVQSYRLVKIDGKPRK